jgi:chromatin remodeling complex protein RSC6
MPKKAKTKTASAPRSKKAASSAKKSRASKSKKAAKSVESTPVVEQPVEIVDAPAQEIPAKTVDSSSPSDSATAETSTSKSVVASVEDTSSALFDQLINTLQSRIASDRQLLKEVRALKKAVSSERRQYQKFVTKYNKRRSGNRRNGFQVPTPISNQMAKFVGVPNGSEMARTEVTKFIHTYIKDKKLQNPDNGQEIFPDSKLKKLLYSGNSKITYFKLQTFLKPHFLKRDKATGEVAQFVAPTSA